MNPFSISLPRSVSIDRKRSQERPPWRRVSLPRAQRHRSHCVPVRRLPSRPQGDLLPLLAACPFPVALPLLQGLHGTLSLPLSQVSGTAESSHQRHSWPGRFPSLRQQSRQTTRPCRSGHWVRMPYSLPHNMHLAVIRITSRPAFGEGRHNAAPARTHAPRVPTPL